MTRARAGRDPDPRPRRIQGPELLAMWIPDRGRERRGQVPATSPAHKGAGRGDAGVLGGYSRNFILSIVSAGVLSFSLDLA